MSLHKLNRAAVAATVTGTLFTHFSIGVPGGGHGSTIIVRVLGAEIRLVTTAGNLSPAITSKTNISASILGTTQTALVDLGSAFNSSTSGDYTITCSLIDVLLDNYTFYQTFEPGSNIHVEVDWHGANRISFNVTAPAALADCPVLDIYFDGEADFGFSGNPPIATFRAEATGQITGAGMETHTWGFDQVDVSDFVDSGITRYRYTMDHRAGAKAQLQCLAFGGVVNISAHRVLVIGANTRPSGFDLEGVLYANDIPYPDSMRVKAVYPKDDPVVLNEELLTANPTFSHSDDQAGYRFENLVTLSGSTTLHTNEGEKPPVTSLEIILDKARLLELNEPMGAADGEFFCAIHGWEFDAFTLTHASQTVIEDCAAVDPSDGIWERDQYDSLVNILGISGGTIELDARFIPSGAGSVFRKWDFQKAKPGHAYRYLRVRFKVVAGSLSVPFEVWTMLGDLSVYEDAFCWRAWTLVGSALDTWTEQVIDLCSPESFGFWSRDPITEEISRTTSPLPPADTTSSLYPLWGAADSPYWGVTYFDRLRIDCEAGQRLEFDYFRCERITAPTLGMFGGDGGQGEGYFSASGGAGVVRPALRANCDEKVALELWDDDQGGGRLISDMIAEVGAAYPAGGSPARWLGWTAAAATYPSWPDNDYLSDSSFAIWVGGGGLIYDGASWTPYKEQGAGTVPAQALGIAVSWYPGCGDVFEWDGGARGPTILVRAAHVLRALVGGIALDSAGAPASGVTVEARRVSDNALHGSDSTDSEGEYFTGSPYMRGDDNYKVAPTSGGHPGANIGAFSNFRHRVVFRTIAGESGPWNLEDDLGRYHRAFVRSGRIRYKRSDHGAPYSWTVDSEVTAGPSDSEPRMTIDHRGLIYLLFTRSGSAYQTRSDDDGATWSTPTVAIASGTHPTIATGIDGEIVRAAVVGTNIKANIQNPGDASPGALFTFLDDAGAALVVADDSFHLQQAHEGPARWLLAVLISGETAISDWWSADLIRWKRT